MIQNFVGYGGYIPPGVNNPAAARLTGGNIQKRKPKCPVKIQRFGLESVRMCASPPPFMGALKPGLRRQIKNEGQVRIEACEGDFFKGLDKTRIEIAQYALICTGGVGKAVTQYPVALFQLWSNELVNMINA